MAWLAASTTHRDQAVIDRLAVVTYEIDNLAVNMLTGLQSPTLLKLLGDREAEKARLEAQLCSHAPVRPSTTVLPHPMLLRRFEAKVANLRDTLDDEAVCGEAAEILSTLVESVTIYPARRVDRKRSPATVGAGTEAAVASAGIAAIYYAADRPVHPHDATQTDTHKDRCLR
jgi:hypothetical protein